MDFRGDVFLSGDVRHVQGGRTITKDEALEIRKLLTGANYHTFSAELRRSCFTFYGPGGTFPYGLVTEKNNVRGIIISVQAHFLNQLVFNSHSSREEIYSSDVLHPSETSREVALAYALANILWQAGENTASVCLLQDGCDFDTSGTYVKDTITEKIRIFEFQDYGELKLFLKRHIDFFTQAHTHGVILFIYSLILSRGMESVHSDFGSTRARLLNETEEMSQSLLCLILTGRAVCYLHNGNVLYDGEGQHLAAAQHGISGRSDVGFLYWNKEKDEIYCNNLVGSMLKTPRRPIWVTQINGRWGLLFTLNPDLVNNWRSEHKFQIKYYTGLHSQTSECNLTIDTRLARTFQSSTAYGKQEEEKKIPALEKTLMTKWQDARIEWNGTTPFV